MTRETRRSARIRSCLLVVALLGLARLPAAAEGNASPSDVRLTGVPTPTVHYYRSTTEVVEIEADGRRRPKDVYDLWLEFAPGPAGDRVTCRRFTVALRGKAAVAIPSLEGWSYVFRALPGGVDERGYIFGIDQSKFEKLADADGAPLPLPTAFLVFNAFVDFHGFGQVFARRTSEGGGIQDLRRFGQTVLHESAHSEPPVSLGSMVAKGSRFRNGAITLELKGVGMVGGRHCAVVGYDSGESSYQMTLTPMPQMTVESKGASRYTGDLYVDLETQWLLRATLIENVVSLTSGALLPQSVASVVERKLLLQALAPTEFDVGRQVASPILPSAAPGRP